MMDSNCSSTIGIEAEEVDRGTITNDFQSPLVYDQWFALPISGLRPAARYKHAAQVAFEKLYVTGGSRNGRYLSDVQVLDLKTSTWSAVRPLLDQNFDKLRDDSSEDILPASSGHSLIQWRNKLLAVAGHVKGISDTVRVWSFDTQTHYWYAMKTAGKVPIARGGQSVSLVGSRLIMFGGEDSNRRLLNDLHVLDLETLTWHEVETKQTLPEPRFDHTATVHEGRYLLIFGGSSHSTCFNDLHILDLETMEWSQPEIRGQEVSARAGHAGTTIGENWFIVGGGDNRSGASETLVLNMSKLVWSVVTSVKGRDPLASEGLSLSSALINGDNLLLAFGGYNGKYNNEVFVLKPKLKDSSHPKIFQSPAAAAAAASVTAAYALTKKKTEEQEQEQEDFKGIKTKVSPLEVARVDVDAVAAEKKLLESTLADVRLENSRLKGDFDELNSTHSELSKELHSVEEQVASERSRCFILEVQIADLRKKLEALDSVQKEVQVLQHQKSVSEQGLGHAGSRKQNSGGVWQWIAGTPRNLEEDNSIPQY